MSGQTVGAALVALVVGFAAGVWKLSADMEPERDRMALALQRSNAARAASERVLSEMIARDARWTEGEMIQGWLSLSLTSRDHYANMSVSQWSVGDGCGLAVSGHVDDVESVTVAATLGPNARPCVQGLLMRVAPSLAGQVEDLANRTASHESVSVEADGTSLLLRWDLDSRSWIVTARHAR